MIFLGALSFISALLLLTDGVILTVKSGFFQFRHLGIVFKVTLKKLIKGRNLKGFKAMALALGSTIGIGNIIGVTSAVIIGGPGSVFWMLISGFGGMIIKYTETYICVKEKNDSGRSSGGPMYVFKLKLSKAFKNLGTLFAVVCILASFCAGNIIQSKSIYRFADIGLNISPVWITVFVLPLLLLIILGKDRVYQNFSAVFVPLMSLFYIIALLVIIFSNLKNVPYAVFSILSGAFGFKSAIGGFSGAVIAQAIRVGAMKGLFTHEAGMGSSPIAHSSAENADPFTQGCWGIIEVFIDTVVVCMLTALAVISSPIYLSGKINDTFTLICSIFESSFGKIGIKLLCISACCFAFASIIGWSFYGIKALEFLTKNTAAQKTYTVVFVFAVPLSLVIGDSLAWMLTDIFNSIMLIINASFLLYFGANTVKPLSKIRNILEIDFKSNYNIEAKRN